MTGDDKDGKKGTPLPEVSYADEKQTRVWPRLDAVRERQPTFDKSEFTDLPITVPLLMLPVRLETRMATLKGVKTLRIRIFPDQLHVWKQDKPLSGDEQTEGRHFWGQMKGADRAAQNAALQQLVLAVGPRRAAHVIEFTDPEFKPEEEEPKPHDRFARPRLVGLPDRWIAIGYGIDGFGFLETSAPVGRSLATSMTNSPDQNTSLLKGVPVTENNKWLIDYDTALSNGMAIDVPLPANILNRGEITSLVVFGVTGSSDPEQGMERVEALLSGHERNSGIGFVPQGTPTNNTAGETTEWSHTDADLGAMLDRITGAENPPEEGNAAELRKALGLRTLKALSRAPHATDLERARSAAMNTVLFEAVFGTFAKELLPDKIGDLPKDDTYIAFRRWFIDNVTGGAPAGTVRVGPQPYGILPVTSLPGSIFALSAPESLAGHVENWVVRLREEWLRALDQVPLLDPNATDRQNARAQPASEIPQLLASHPHPVRLFRRVLEAGKDEIVAKYRGATRRLETGNPELYGLFATRQSVFERAENIDTQIAFWASLDLDIRNKPGMTQSWRDESRRQVVEILEILGLFEQRQRPLKSLGLNLFQGAIRSTGSSTKPLSAYLSAAHGETSEEFIDFPLVSLDEPENGDSHLTAPGYMLELARFQKAKHRQGKETPRLPEIPPDLLYQLIFAGFDGMAEEDADEMIRALELLGSTASAADLDRLARETIGLATHRLDAWYTSLASSRVKEMRRDPKTETGLAVGAFGWLTDLKFAEAPPSSGFIHAPSLPHAATAAVLRSGWLAHGNAAKTSPAAVNTDSARIRLAQGLLEGVRQGQQVGTLLGYRFERGLRDSGLAGSIRDVRALVINRTGSDATLDEPVDGGALLELFQSKGLVNEPLFDGTALETHVEQLVDIFDAVHDLTLFEGTHAATQGRPEHAAAVFEAVNQGAQLPPEFTAQRNPRNGIGIDHRLMLLFTVSEDQDKKEPGTGYIGGWAAGQRDRFAPELERWLQSVVPAATGIGFFVDQKQIMLADLELSVLDMLYLMDESPNELSSGLRVLTAKAIGTDPEQLVASPVSLTGTKAEVQLEEFQLLALELRALIEDAAPVGPAALGKRTADVAKSPGPDTTPTNRIETALDTLDAAIDDEDLITLARFGLSAGSPSARLERAARVSKLVRGNKGQVSASERAALLFGRKVPVARSFTMPAAAGVPFHEEFSKHPALFDWLDKVGAVRTPVGHLTNARFLSELLGARPLTLRIGQDVLLNGEDWAAVSRPPDGGGGRLCIAAITNGDPPKAGRTVTGLMIDQWSERIPPGDQMTGLAFHYDAPSTKPPQSWLLATPPPGAEHWRMIDLAGILFDTLQFAALRMVSPEDLSDFGAVLPTVYTAHQRHPVKKGKNK